MNDTDRHLKRVISLARDAKPEPPATPEAVRFFAQRTLSAWQQRSAARVAPDPLRLWERVGNWSLAGATAALLMVLSLHAEPPPPNPLDVFGPVDTEESNLF
jgi:hypothetical protein